MTKESECEIFWDCQHGMKDIFIFTLGYFHLVGAIFTPRGKIYSFEGKMKLAPFHAMLVCNILGKTVTQWSLQNF